MDINLPQCTSCGRNGAAYHVVDMKSAGGSFHYCCDCWDRMQAAIKQGGPPHDAADPWLALVASLAKSISDPAGPGDKLAGKVIRDHLVDTISAKVRMILSAEFLDKIREIADVLITCLRREGTIYTCGSGPCAGEARHIAGELLGRYKLPSRRGLPAVCLSSDPALLDDFSHMDLFVRQVEALVTERDVLFGVSANGNSAPVVRALRQASEQGAFAIGMCGGEGGDMLDATRLSLIVPSSQNQTIQECQAASVHILCELVEQALCGESDGAEPVMA